MVTDIRVVLHKGCTTVESYIDFNEAIGDLNCLSPTVLTIAMTCIYASLIG
jgi:hypothetical protein